MSSDCLVLLLEDDDLKLYIIYDNIRQMYCIWGQAISTATDNKNNIYEPFYFSCDKKDKKQLYLFIEFILDSPINVCLYNYNDLPNGCSEITFPLLEELNTDKKVISYYTDQEYDQKYITSLLNILACIKNEYHL
jgi:hypothetical protein